MIYGKLNNLQPPVKNAAPNGATAARIKEFIAAHPGQYSKTALRENSSGKDGELKASKPDVSAAIENLLANGDLITRPPTAAEREKFGHSHQTKTVLDVPAKKA
jgi:hypothetical protein